MSDTRYTMQYDTEQRASQYDAPAWQVRRPSTVLIDAEPRRRFRIPSILKTASVFVLGALSLTVLEKYAPSEWRPSTIVGTFDARITSTVKAAELNQQVQFEAWATQAKLAGEQNAESYRAAMAATNANYQALYDRTKIYAQAAATMQGQYLQMRLSQENAQSGSDTGIINIVKMFGHGMNALEAGSGDDALAYSDAMSRQVAERMTKAAMEGSRIDVTGWDTNLPSPQAVRAELERYAPKPIPAPPVLSENPASLGKAN